MNDISIVDNKIINELIEKIDSQIENQTEDIIRDMNDPMINALLDEINCNHETFETFDDNDANDSNNIIDELICETQNIQILEHIETLLGKIKKIKKFGSTHKAMDIVKSLNFELYKYTEELNVFKSNIINLNKYIVNNDEYEQLPSNNNIEYVTIRLDTIKTQIKNIKTKKNKIIAGCVAGSVVGGIIFGSVGAIFGGGISGAITGSVGAGSGAVIGSKIMSYF